MFAPIWYILLADLTIVYPPHLSGDYYTVLIFDLITVLDFRDYSGDPILPLLQRRKTALPGWLERY
jgi:hypothetical protein